MISLAGALAWLEARCPTLPAETVALSRAAGRVLARDVVLRALPAWPMALIDGMAVLAAETEGASEYAPLPCRGVEVRAGFSMPAGTDAIAEIYEGGAVLAPVARGHGVAGMGHDVAAGSLLRAGVRLTPLHLAMLNAAPSVVRRPCLGGDASAMIVALAEQEGAGDGGLADLLLNPVGGFPVSLGGVAIRPGERTELGLLDGVPALRLPLHPADAASVFALLVAPMLRRMGGRAERAAVRVRLMRKIASGLGRVDAVRVRVEGSEATPLGPAEGLGLAIAETATGLVLVPEGSEGYPAGAMVDVIPL